ncbi:unnamed protein product [Penicillium manginii]
MNLLVKLNQKNEDRFLLDLAGFSGLSPFPVNESDATVDLRLLLTATHCLSVTLEFGIGFQIYTKKPSRSPILQQ